MEWFWGLRRLAQYLGINVGIVRFIALFLVFSGFTNIIIYLLMAVFIPAKY